MRFAFYGLGDMGGLVLRGGRVLILLYSLDLRRRLSFLKDQWLRPWEDDLRFSEKTGCCGGGGEKSKLMIETKTTTAK